MAVISDTAIATAARDAGIPADQIAIAVAIALAESGGDTMAHNAKPPDNSYGLWQINMLGNLGPSRRNQFNLNRNEDLFNTANNARAMAAISNKGKNWRPWTTYTRGTYLRYLNRGKTAASGVGGGTTSNASVSGWGSLEYLAKLATDPMVYRKAALFVLGSFLLLVGFVMLFKLQNLASPLAKIGKVGKLVK